MVSSLLLTIVFGSACEGPPSELGFSWRAALRGRAQATLSVCGDATGEAVLAVGGRDSGGEILEWRAGGWRAQPVEGGVDLLWWCWVGDHVRVVVGAGGSVAIDRGEGWRRDETASALLGGVVLYGVWGLGDELFVVGGPEAGVGDGVIAHYDGHEWRRMQAPPGPTLFKIWGVDADNVWAVGREGRVLYFDGSSWNTQETPTEETLISLWGRSAAEIYAVGGDARGVIVRFDGELWTHYADGPEALAGVWTAPLRPLYVSGVRGFVARYESADRFRATTLADDTCVHSLFGTRSVDGVQRVVAASSDLFSGSDDSWRGTVWVHGGALDGPLPVDAGVDDGGGWPDARLRPDAADEDARPLDAGAADAMTEDAHPRDAASAVDGATDGTSSADAALPGPGEVCTPPTLACETGLTCWYLAGSGYPACTRECTLATECADFGDGACCARPGFQTLTTVCIMAGSFECTTPF